MSVNAIPGLGQAVRVGGGGRRLIEVQRSGGGRRTDAFPLLPDVEKQRTVKNEAGQHTREKVLQWSKIKRVDQLLLHIRNS